MAYRYQKIQNINIDYCYLALIFKLNMTDVWHFLKVFAWCMSFSIVWNVKELLFRMREKKKTDVSLDWIEPKLERRVILYSIVAVKDFPRVQKCVWSFVFEIYIKRHAKLFFVVTNENLPWHEIKANAYKLTFYVRSHKICPFTW